MFIVHVHVHVKPDCIEPFKRATLENARKIINEPGIARFDVLQSSDDPAHFILVEVYRSADDPAMHKQTNHYLTWRDTVADMMAVPRQGIKYSNIYPEDQKW